MFAGSIISYPILGHVKGRIFIQPITEETTKSSVIKTPAQA